MKSHVKFHSADGRRRILVVDDEAINRALLGSVLEKDYEPVFAANGQEALDIIEARADTLSLILLDLLMPVMNGTEVLRRVKKDPRTQLIPVIVVTSDQSAEVECLGLGAIDFIPKPYPQPEVILARVLRTIELSEDRDILRFTERDALTGLYNREFFYRYAQQFDQHHRDMEMDCIAVDIYHFHMINERFGTSCGDSLLRRVGERLREAVQDDGGIVCRREADTFLVYCPHREDYGELLTAASVSLEEEASQGPVRLRMGVYARADKSIDIERRFDRATLAADTVRASLVRNVAMYDKAMHDKELFAEQLIGDFRQALTDGQFRVFYQPKFDVRPEIPVLASAEALVRWFHPSLGMISPGTFIPLFEENGLIQELDLFVWEHAAAQIADWKRRFGFTVPVSVNVSRVDMYDPRLISTLLGLLSANGLSPAELLLEITESAYTQDSEQIIGTVRRLRDLGFQVEMDDFGTGYSSLNMISTLPIDALKLDMQFIRNAFQGHRDTRMLEVIIDIADYLSVPVIAEGVETEEQLNALRTMGCDIVQGYYFSKPVPADEYERFMRERQAYNAAEAPAEARQSRQERRDAAFGRIAHALSSGFERIYYVDTDNNRYIEFSSQGRYEDLQIEHSGADFFEDIRNSLCSLVCPEDQERVSLFLRRESLLTQLVGSLPFSLTYRLMIGGKPTYYTMKAVRAGVHDSHHIVIGLSNVEKEIREAQEITPMSALNFQSLAQALSSDLVSIYDVDPRTGAYTEYIARDDYRKLPMTVTGERFFEECRDNINRVVYSDDREKMTRALDRDSLLAALEENGAFSVIYRLMMDGHPVYHQLKAIPLGSGAQQRVIIGLSNIDAQISGPDKLTMERENAITYARIAQVLAQDYFCIYYVDTQTDHFIEYCSYGSYAALGIEKSGEDFFGVSRRNIARVVACEDRANVLNVFTRENVLRELDRTGVFTLTYQLLIEGAPVYMHLKASRMEDRSDPHIVIGVSDIDAQIRREQAQAKALANAEMIANRDALTGVKNKHAFMEAEKRWNSLIESGETEPFAVVVIDVNDLKEVNDTLGHTAGDQYLRDACAVICRIFDHSPVFRIGGDEFAAILTRSDYKNRAQLLRQLMDMNGTHTETHALRIACGSADFVPGLDTAFRTVFERADGSMYENKKRLKQGRA